MRRDNTSTTVVMRGLAITVGSKPTFLASMGSAEPTSLEAMTVHKSVRDTTMATSGDYERFFEQDGVRYHHIIDPDTLQPPQYWRAVSIICPDSGVADALSTALFCMDQADGQALLDEFGAKAVWIAMDGSLVFSPGFEESVREIV